MIKVFKFGGASVKDADAVKNVASILSLYKEDKLSADNLEALKDNINSILEIEKEIDLKNSEIKKIQEEEKMTDEEVSQIPMG